MIVLNLIVFKIFLLIFLKTMGIQTSLLIVATHTTKTGQNAHLKILK